MTVKHSILISSIEFNSLFYNLSLSGRLDLKISHSIQAKRSLAEHDIS